MPNNIASILKAEIARVSRKEARSECAPVKKAIASYRTEIAALKRRALALEQQVRRVAKSVAKPEPSGDEAADSTRQLRRFSAKGFATHRRRLGLTAQDCGLLIGASSQSIYNWEEGKARPRPEYLPAIAALRTLGKKRAAEIAASRQPEATRV